MAQRWSASRHGSGGSFLFTKRRSLVPNGRDRSKRLLFEPLELRQMLSVLPVTTTGGFGVTGTEGQPSAVQTMATFLDPQGAQAASAYTANIDWGDGTTSPGTVVPGATSGGQADILFLTDTTGSMGGVIANLETAFNDIASAIASAYGPGSATPMDIHYGVADYKDYLDGSPYNTAGINLDQPFTSNVTAVQTAIDSLTADGGEDWPEENLKALDSAANNWTLNDGRRVGYRRPRDCAEDYRLGRRRPRMVPRFDARRRRPRQLLSLVGRYHCGPEDCGRQCHRNGHPAAESGHRPERSGWWQLGQPGLPVRPESRGSDLYGDRRLGRLQHRLLHRLDDVRERRGRRDHEPRQHDIFGPSQPHVQRGRQLRGHHHGHGHGRDQHRRYKLGHSGRTRP